MEADTEIDRKTKGDTEMDISTDTERNDKTNIHIGTVDDKLSAITRYLCTDLTGILRS